MRINSHQYGRSTTFFFDLDDTLVESGAASWIACTDLVNSFLACKGVDESYTSAHLAQNCVGVPLVVFISKLAKQHGFEVSAREFVELNARAEPLILDYFASRLRPVESVRNVLEELRRNNCTIGIVSTSSHQWIDVCLRASELKDLVRTDLIFSASSESVPAKPDPTIYRMALSALPRDASVVAVEDSPSGIKSAVAAGVPTVVGCVAFGILGTRAQQATTLRQLGASAVFDDWNAFFPAVTRAMHAPVVQSVQFLPERMTANLTLK